MADVIAMVVDGMPLMCDVTDVITTWQMLEPIGWNGLADVIANVADVIATGS